MRIFGLEIRRADKKALQTVTDRGGWHRIYESFTGSWQRGIEVNQDTVLAYSAVYACTTLIAQDIGKLPLKLVKQDANGIWSETTNPAYSPVLRKPNRYQTRIKFFENWVTSKLIHGNAYALKERDGRGMVTALYLLNPCRVTPLVSDDGSVFYRLKTDTLNGITDEIIVPAREMVHDPMVTLFHPLVGVSPIFACGLAGMQGIAIQNNSAAFFQNMSRPSGILTAPGEIADETATRMKAAWEENFGGNNIGRVAVLGDGLTYEPMSINPHDAQLIEQLKWTAEMVCTCFHVPSYMIGVGQMPTYNNIEALNQQYYAQCLQSLIESIELHLDEGLEVVKPSESLGVMFDIDALLRMDTATRFKAHSEAINGGWLSPNEARRKEDLQPVQGGETPYLQQQNYSLAALAKRDAKEDPFGTQKPPAEKPAVQDAQDAEKFLSMLYLKAPETFANARA